MFGKLVILMLLALVVSRRASGKRRRSRSVVTIEESALKDPKLFCKEKLSSFIHCAWPWPKKLGDIRGGHRWLVKGKNSKELEVLNLFLASKDRYATIGDYISAKGDAENIFLQARRECAALRGLHEAFPKAAGRKNVMKCLAINFDFDKNDNSKTSRWADKTMLMYTITEYTGDRNLGSLAEKLVAKHPMEALATLGALIAQVLKGISLLHRASPPIIHHDVRPGNIMVTKIKTKGGKRYTAHVVGFEAMAFGNMDNVCSLTAGNALYAPQEWKQQTERCRGGENFDPEQAEKYDIFSFGMTLVELISGRRAVDTLQQVAGLWCGMVPTYFCNPSSEVKFPTTMPEESKRKFSETGCAAARTSCSTPQVWDERTQKIDHDFLGELVSDENLFFWLLSSALRNPAESRACAKKKRSRASGCFRNLFWKKMKPEESRGQLVAAMLGHRRAASFLKAVSRTLRVAPAERPSATHLLSFPWMTGEPEKEFAFTKDKDQLGLSYNLIDGISCKKPELLGSGGFGQAWLAQTTQSVEEKEVVIKVMLVQVEDKFRYLTMRDYLYPRDDQKKMIQSTVSQAKRECDTLIKLHKDNPTAMGHKNVMQCKATNFGSDLDEEMVDLDVPLFLTLSHCGRVELNKYAQRVMSHTETSVEKLRKIFKQVLQGVNFLSKNSPPVIHHDLKPPNIVVKMGRDEDVASLVDFGAVAFGSEDDVCRITSVTPGFVAPEWGVQTDLCKMGANFDVSYPGTFDVYSLAMTWVSIISLSDAIDLFGKVHELWCSRVKTDWCSGKAQDFGADVPKHFRAKVGRSECAVEEGICKRNVAEWNEQGELKNVFHHYLEHLLLSKQLKTINRERAIISAMYGAVELIAKDGSPRAFNTMTEMLKDENAVSFLIAILKGIKFKAGERPSVSELLDEPWMTQGKAAAAAKSYDWSWTTK